MNHLLPVGWSTFRHIFLVSLINIPALWQHWTATQPPQTALRHRIFAWNAHTSERTLVKIVSGTNKTIRMDFIQIRQFWTSVQFHKSYWFVNFDVTWNSVETITLFNMEPYCSYMMKIWIYTTKKSSAYYIPPQIYFSDVFNDSMEQLLSYGWNCWIITITYFKKF